MEWFLYNRDLLHERVNMVGDRKLSKKLHGNTWMINNIDREN